MADSQSNKSYFNSEADKNRDQWKHGDGERTFRTKNIRASMYASGLFDDVIKYEQPDWIWQKADGESEPENEDSVEAENEEATFGEEEFTDEELPKFRHLVRAKKLEFKAQYGKAHLKTWTTSERKCLGGLRDVKGDGKPPFWDPNINCTNINVPHIAWVWGWRKKWREFKQQGGLAQLKMISKGMTPMPTSTETNTTSGGGATSGTGGGANTNGPKPTPKLDLPSGGKKSMAGINIILLLGIGLAAIKLFK